MERSVPEGELRTIVADELKMHFSFIRELLKEQFSPIADRLSSGRKYLSDKKEL